MRDRTADGDALVHLRGQSKVVPGALAAFDGLGSGEPAQWNFFPLQSCNHAAAQVFVDLNAKAGALALSRGRGTPPGSIGSRCRLAHHKQGREADD